MIYKLVGPVLVQQDKAEAETTVKGRLDFIGKEMFVHVPFCVQCANEVVRSRLEGEIKEAQGRLEKKRMEIIQLQSSLQAAAPKN